MASELTETMRRVDARLRELRTQIREIVSGKPTPSAAYAARDAPPSEAEASDSVMMMLRKREALGADLPGGVSFDYVIGTGARRWPTNRAPPRQSPRPWPPHARLSDRTV